MKRFAASLAAACLIAGAPAWAGEDAQLMIEFSGPPQVNSTYDELTEEETFVGHYSGTVSDTPENLLVGAEVNCEFDGYAAPGRAFSCGFTTVEQVSGRCLFTAEGGDTAVAEWSCRTGAMMTSDARCEGRAKWIEGTGKFAGITGDARFHSDLFLQPGKGFAKWRGEWRIPSLAMAR